MAGAVLLMRVKICGLCRPVDARTAQDAGADFGGVILSPGGPRSQTVASAARVLDGAPGLARVGVFVDAAEADILATARALTLSVLQLHGSESPAQVAALRAAGPWRVWKAVRPRSADDFRAALERYARVVDGVLVDGWSAEAAGGAGAMFSWNEVARLRQLVPAGIELIVAGGLHPENVAAAIVALRPDAVDVSSGVEETRGIKSEERLRAFVAAARAAAGAVEQEQA